MIGILLNEKSLFKKLKSNFTIFIFQLLIFFTILPLYQDNDINVEDWKSAIFWYIICLNILYIKRDIGS